jgi:hypothetical protein
LLLLSHGIDCRDLEIDWREIRDPPETLAMILYSRGIGGRALASPARLSRMR